MKQDIILSRNKNKYQSRDDMLSALNDTVVHKTGTPLLHIYVDENGNDVGMITIGIGDGQGKDKYQILVTEVDLGILSTYTNETPMWIDLGGMKIGDTFNKVTYNEMFTKLLYPYVPPTISLSSSPSSKVSEKGTSVDNIKLTATTKKFARDIKTVKFYLNSSEIYNVDSPNPIGGQEIYTHDSVIDNSTFQAKVFDGEQEVSSNTLSFTFVYPCYVGKVSSNVITPTQDNIKSLTKKVQNPGNISVTYSYADEKACIATPPGWEIKSITDPSGYELIDSFRKDIVSVTGIDNKPVDYNVYTMIESVGLENFKITFIR